MPESDHYHIQIGYEKLDRMWHDALPSAVVASHEHASVVVGWALWLGFSVRITTCNKPSEGA